MNKIKYLTRPQIYKVTKEFLAHCKKNVHPITPLTKKEDMFLWNRDKTLYVEKDEYETITQLKIFNSIWEKTNPDLKDFYSKNGISDSFYAVFCHYVFDEGKSLTVDEWVYDWTNRKKIYTTYCFKIINIPILKKRVSFNSNVFIDKVSRINLIRTFVKIKETDDNAILSTVEKNDTALSVKVRGCASEKAYKKAINLAQKVIDCINLVYGLYKYPLQIRKWNVKEQDGYSFPRFCETDAISFFINDRKKFRTLSFEPSPNLQFVTQDDLIKIRDYVDGMIRLPDLLSENVLMKRYQIAFSWLGQAIRDPLQYRGFLQGMISLDTFLSREKPEIKNQRIMTSDGQSIKLFTSSRRKSEEVDRLTWKKTQVADIVSFIDKGISFSQQEIWDKFMHYGDLRDEIVHDGITTVDENEYKTFFTLTVNFFINVFIKIIDKNMSTVGDLWLYCHPEIINRRLESLKN